MIKNIIQFIIIFFVGGLFTFIATKIKNKTSKFIYTVQTNRIALSANYPVFGAVKVSWQDNDVRNLYFTTIIIENATDKDYENFELKIYTENETILLNEQNKIIDTPYFLEWSTKFKKQLEFSQGDQLSNTQLNIYNHSREYFVKVFNRGQKIQFSFLITRPNDDLNPNIFVSTLTKGVKIKYINRPNVVLSEIWGVSIKTALIRGIFILIIVALLCGFFIKNIWLVVAICTIVGTTSNLLGAFEYKLEKFFINLISN